MEDETIALIVDSYAVLFALLGLAVFIVFCVDFIRYWTFVSFISGILFTSLLWSIALGLRKRIYYARFPTIALCIIGVIPVVVLAIRLDLRILFSLPILFYGVNFFSFNHDTKRLLEKRPEMYFEELQE